MRVRCINDKWQAAPGCEEAPRPIFMHDYTVVETKILDGNEAHILLELGDEYGYNTKHFAPLDSDLDETELVTEEFNEKYCIPVNS